MCLEDPYIAIYEYPLHCWQYLSNPSTKPAPPLHSLPQVKCPECRAEHRIPYNGIQSFPANVTLQRFLEAQIEITGEAPDPHTGNHVLFQYRLVIQETSYLHNLDFPLERYSPL